MHRRSVLPTSARWRSSPTRQGSWPTCSSSTRVSAPSASIRTDRERDRVRDAGFGHSGGPDIKNTTFFFGLAADTPIDGPPCGRFFTRSARRPGALSRQRQRLGASAGARSSIILRLPALPGLTTVRNAPTTSSLWRERMRTSSRGLRRSLLAAAALLCLSGAASAQMELKIMAPAAPGGWDQTARSMQQALVQSGAAKSVQVTNIPAPAAPSASRSSSTAPRATATS